MELRALSLEVFHPYPSLVLFDDPFGNGQPESGPVCLAFGDEGLENRLRNVLGHPAAGITDLQVKIAIFAPALDGNPAIPADRLFRVDHQVVNHAAQAILIHPSVRSR